ARLKKKVVEARFGRIRFRVPIVFPAGEWGHGDENRFGASAALESEKGAPVEDEVELDVASASIELEIPFAFAPGCRFAAGNDRTVSGEKPVSDGADKLETAVESPRIEIVEKETADSARFFSVLQVEILVALFFVARINIRSERVAN